VNLWKEFSKGIVSRNPLLRLVLGMCPALAVTTAAANGVAMGLAATFVLVCSNFVVAVFRKVIPPAVRIPIFIVIIAAFVTIIDLMMNAFAHEMHKVLGLFVPLIVVNCIILGRAEAFASRNPVLVSVIDGLGMGVGFTLALVVLGAIREIVGNGTIFGISVVTEAYEPAVIMLLPPGAFLALGLLLGAINKLTGVEGA
jgi:electron transport complex protein RnfE